MTAGPGNRTTHDPPDDGPDERARVARAATALALAAAGATVLAALLSAGHGPLFALRALAEAAACAALTAAMIHVGPGRRATWGPMALGMGIWALTDAAVWAWPRRSPIEAGPHDVGWIAGAAAIAVGLTIVYVRLRPERDLQGVLDGIAMTVVVGVLTWGLVLEGHPGMTTADRAVIVVIPAIALALVVGLGWVALDRRPAEPWLLLLIAALALRLAAGTARMQAGPEDALPETLSLMLAAASAAAFAAAGLWRIRCAAPERPARRALPTWAAVLPLAVLPVAVTALTWSWSPVAALLLGAATGVVLVRVGMGTEMGRRAEHDLAVSERRLTEVLDAARDGFWRSDLTQDRLELSARLMEILGHPAVPGRMTLPEFYALVHADDLPGMLERLDAHLAGATPSFVAEHRMRRADGRWIWVLARGRVTGHAEDGRPLGVTGAVSDVTERREAQDAARGNAARLQAVMGAMGDGMIVVAPDRRLVDVNRRFTEMTGFSREELLGTPPPWPFWPEESSGGLGAIVEHLEAGGTGTVETTLVDRSGRRLAVEAVWSNLVGDDGEAVSHVVTMRDVTARRAAERVVRDSEARLRTVITAMGEGVILHHADGSRGMCNPAAALILGLTEEQLLDPHAPMDPRWTPLREDGRAFPPEEHPAFVAMRTGRRIHGVIMGVDSPTLAERRWIRMSAEPVGPFDAAGLPASVVTTLADVTEHHRAEAAVRDERDFSQTVLGAMSDGMVVLDRDGALVTVNERFCELTGLGLKELAGARPPFPWWPDERREELQADLQRFLAGAEGEHQSVVRTADGLLREVEVGWSHVSDTDGDATAHVMTVRDATARLIADRAIRESEERFRTLVEVQGDAVVRLTPDGVVRYASPSVERLLGVRLVPGRSTPLAMILGPDREAARTAFLTALDGEPSAPVAVRIRRDDGRRIWVEGTARPVLGGAGEVAEVQLGLTDVTRRRLEERDQEGRNRVSELIATGGSAPAIASVIATEVAAVADADLVIVLRFVGTAGRVEAAWPHDAATRAGAGAAGLIDMARGGTACAAVWQTGAAATVPLRGSAAGIAGEDLELLTGSAVPIRVGGVLWGCLAAGTTEADFPAGTTERLERFADLAALAVEAVRTREDLEHRATTDPLTGLVNRRAFMERLRIEAERARRHGHDLALVMLDLDHFKSVNDTHGHAAGDRVLQQVARRMQALGRAHDTVARLGGEELAWLLPETDADAAFRAAERLRAAIGGGPAEDLAGVTASLGVAGLAAAGDVENLMLHADAALYWAKRNGRDRVALHSDPLTRDLAAADPRGAPVPD